MNALSGQATDSGRYRLWLLFLPASLIVTLSFVNNFNALAPAAYAQDHYTLFRSKLVTYRF